MDVSPSDTTIAEECPSTGRLKDRFDRRISEDFSSKEQVNGIFGFSDGFARAAGGPTRLAQKENYKKERYNLEMERGHECSTSSSSTTTALSLPRIAPRCDQIEPSQDLANLVSHEELTSDFQSVNELIEDVTRGLRLDHLGAPDADGVVQDPVTAAREAAKRRKVDVARRAKRKEQRAKDPLQAVAHKIENRRKGKDEREDQDDKVEVEIPMLKVEVARRHADGALKPSMVSMVDTRKLQHRCMLLNEGPVTVQRLMHVQHQKERRARLRRAMLLASMETSSSMSSPPGSPQARGPKSLEARRRGPRTPNFASFHRLPASWEARLENAQHEKCRYHLTNIMKKLNKTRGIDGDVKVQLKEQLGESLEKEGLSKSRVLALAADDGSFQSKPSGSDMVPRRTIRPSHCHKRDQASDARPRKVRARVCIWRSAARWVMLHTNLVRKAHAIKLVKGFCLNIGEWARIRNAIHRMVTSVRILQKMFRAWNVTRKRHCEQLAKEWQRIEDQALTNCFKGYAQIILEELQQKQKENHLNDAHLKMFIAKQVGKGRLGKTQMPLSQIIQHLNNGGTSSMEHNIANLVDWKAYRIPAEVRRRAISSFYMQQLKKHVRLKKQLEQTIRSEVQNQMEIKQFLKQFGQVADPSARSAQVVITALDRRLAELPSWWDMPEDKCLEMIASCATSLADVEPFGDHPVNKDFPSPSGSKGSRVAAGLKFGREAAAAAAARSGKQGLSRSVDFSGKKRVDMDEVFRRFTPQFRHTSEAEVGSELSNSHQDPFEP